MLGWELHVDFRAELHTSVGTRTLVQTLLQMAHGRLQLRFKNMMSIGVPVSDTASELHSNTGSTCDAD